ncbi:hypothetical protein M885DRAFT_610749 [Pelagophyceae sp. CCMP2097]|nr:hypothetical protein M885DRAFT_610749 [Pelagophyceae sp. CCMP2097]
MGSPAGASLAFSLRRLPRRERRSCPPVDVAANPALGLVVPRLDLLVLTSLDGVAANPALGFDVRRLDPFVPTLPGGVAASPALGLGVLRMYPHLPTPPDGVEAEPAFGLGAPRLDPLVPMPPDGVAAVPSLDLDVQSLDLLVPTARGAPRGEVRDGLRRRRTAVVAAPKLLLRCLSVLGLAHVSASGSTASTDAPAVAVCVSGQLRTFLDPVLQFTWLTNFHAEGYEYFLSTDQPVDASELMIGPVKRSYVDVGDFPPTTVADPLGKVRCAATGGRAANLKNYGQVMRYVPCWRLIISEESDRGARYDYVLRTRTDVVFYARFPDFSTEPSFVHFTKEKDGLFFDDHLSLARRENMHTILINPSLMYHECHDRERWSRACGQKITGDLFYNKLRRRWPCCSMALMVVYEPPETSMRSCEFLWEGNKCVNKCDLDLLSKSHTHHSGKAACPNQIQKLNKAKAGLARLRLANGTRANIRSGAVHV